MLNPAKTYLAVILIGIAILNSSCQLLAQSAQIGPGKVVGKIEDPRLDEISGIVASRRQDVLWVHNDSGDAAQFYALDLKGRLLGIYRLQGVNARDWEDIAIGPGPDPNQHYLYLGDIGDNSGRYPSISVYQVPEPRVTGDKPQQVQYIRARTTIHLTYPDKARDAESLMIDPLKGDLYIISKRDLFSRVYRLSPPISTSPQVLEHMTLLPWGFATAADISPGGLRIVVRSLNYAMEWERNPSNPAWKYLHLPGKTITLMPELQGEAICYNRDGTGLYSVSEGRQPNLHFYPCLTKADPQGIPPTK